MKSTSHKTPITNRDLKQKLHTKDYIDYAKQMEDHLYSFERSSLEGMDVITDNLGKMAEQLGETYTMGMTSCIESNYKSLKTMYQLGKDMMSGYHKAMNDLIQASNEALECRSIDEFYNLQRKSLANLTHDWANEFRTLNGKAMGGHITCILPPD